MLLQLLSLKLRLLAMMLVWHRVPQAQPALQLTIATLPLPQAMHPWPAPLLVPHHQLLPLHLMLLPLLPPLPRQHLAQRVLHRAPLIVLSHHLLLLLQVQLLVLLPVHHRQHPAQLVPHPVHARLHRVLHQLHLVLARQLRPHRARHPVLLMLITVPLLLALLFWPAPQLQPHLVLNLSLPALLVPLFLMIQLPAPPLA